MIGLEGIALSLLREIRLLQTLHHPNIVSLLDIYHKKGLLYFVLEWAPVTLIDLINDKENTKLEPAHVKCLLK